VRYWEAMYLRADPPNLVAQIRTWQACDVVPAAGVVPQSEGMTAHLLIAVADDQCVEPALSVAAGDSPLPSCVTLVVRGLRTHAGRPKSCDHIS